MDKRKKITGTWQGIYSFDSVAESELEPVPFTLTLEQGWFGRFKGKVTDDGPPGMPGTGVIEGYFSFPKISFTKRMPVCYVATPDLRIITLREYLLENGESCDHDVPHMPILYEGAFLNPRRAQGTWTIEPQLVPLGDGRAFETGGSTGGWTIEPRAV